MSEQQVMTDAERALLEKALTHGCDYIRDEVEAVNRERLVRAYGSLPAAREELERLHGQVTELTKQYRELRDLFYRGGVDVPKWVTP